MDLKSKIVEDKKQKLEQLKEKLARYMPEFLDKKRHFRGVKHENSLSELQYTQYMVYRELVEGLKNEIRKLETELRLKTRVK